MLSAGLAGIGAAFVVGSIARGIVLELWFLRIIVTDGPSPRFEQLLLPSWLVGAYVAGRLGGLRAIGVVALYTVAALSVTVFLAYEGSIQCALVPRVCPITADLEPIARMAAWIVLGLVLGAALARLIHVRIPIRRGLAAVSIFALGNLVLIPIFMVARYTVCFSLDFIVQCGWQEDLLSASGWIAEGVLAGIVLARLGGRSMEAVGLGGLLALAYLPAPFHQLGMALGESLIRGLAFAGPLLGMLAFMLVAVILRASRAIAPKRSRSDIARPTGSYSRWQPRDSPGAKHCGPVF